MTQALMKEDWERIRFALSHFQHNKEMYATLQKVEAILAPRGKD